MAQTKGSKKVSSPCEQYVVSKLESVEKELEALKKEHELLKKVHRDYVELVRLGTKYFRVEINKNDYTDKDAIWVYWNGDLVDLCDVDYLQDKHALNDLIKLIKKGQTKVEREQ